MEALIGVKSGIGGNLNVDKDLGFVWGGEMPSPTPMPMPSPTPMPMPMPSPTPTPMVEPLSISHRIHPWGGDPFDAY
jgi:hypothetical protein